MLVLQRKPQETIHLDGGIIITVCRVDGDRVTIGLQAPKEIRILRGELVCRPSPLERHDSFPGEAA